MVIFRWTQELLMLTNCAFLIGYKVTNNTKHHWLMLTFYIILLSWLFFSQYLLHSSPLSFIKINLVFIYWGNWGDCRWLVVACNWLCSVKDWEWSDFWPYGLRQGAWNRDQIRLVPGVLSWFSIKGDEGREPCEDTCQTLWVSAGNALVAVRVNLRPFHLTLNGAPDALTVLAF